MTESHGRRRVLVLASTYPRWQGDHEPGFVHELCRRLSGDFEVTVITSRSPGADAYALIDGVEVIRYRYAPRALETLVYGGGIAAQLKRHPWKLLLVPGFVSGQYLAARKLMRARTVDVIHAHWLLPQGLIASRLARSFDVPFVVTSHGGDLFGLRGRWLERAKRHVAAAAQAMTVVSSAMLEEVTKLGLQPRAIAVLPMGADMHDRFKPDLSLARSSDELLFVGRLVAKKGLPHLLDALPEVLRRRPATRLTVAGFGPDEADLKAQVKRLGLERQVDFVGPQPPAALPALYHRAALLVAPFIRDSSGNQEGLPVVVMEAIGCGCPVVAGEVAGMRDLFGDAASGICIDPTNTAALVEAILHALDEPERVRAEAVRLREQAIARIDWQVIAGGYAKLLSKVVAEASVAAA